MDSEDHCAGVKEGGNEDALLDLKPGKAILVLVAKNMAELCLCSHSL